MAGHLLDDLVWNSRYIGTGERTFSDVHGVADACRYDFGVDAVQAEHFGHFRYQVGPADADVVQASYERAYERGSGPGRKESLVGGEDERHIDLDALGGQDVARLEAFDRHRNLDYHVPVDGRYLPSFPYHAFRVGRSGLDFTADAPLLFESS